MPRTPAGLVVLEAEGEVRNLVESMPKRFTSVIEAEGGPIDY